MWSAPAGCRDHVSGTAAADRLGLDPGQPAEPGRRGYPPRARAASGQCPAPVRYTRSGRHRWRGPSRTGPGHTTAAAAAIVVGTSYHGQRVRSSPAIRRPCPECDALPDGAPSGRVKHYLRGFHPARLAGWPASRPHCPPLRGRLRQDKRPHRGETGKGPRRMSAMPSIGQMEQWISEGGCEAASGCWAEPDGHQPARQALLAAAPGPDLT